MSMVFPLLSSYSFGIELKVTCIKFFKASHESGQLSGEVGSGFIALISKRKGATNHRF